MKCISMLLVGMVVCLPAFSGASDGNDPWKSSACSDQVCQESSNHYTQPYCLEEVSSTGAKTCILSNITRGLSSTGSNTKTAIQAYCNNLLLLGTGGSIIYFSKPSSTSTGWDWQYTFDSRQSLFLYALCGSFKDTGFVVGSSLSGVFKGDVVKILNLQQRVFENNVQKDLCSLSKDNTTLQDCDISIYATKIFDGIMSDLYKIKYAQVLHLDTVEKFNVKRNVEHFMSGYYQIGGEYKDIKKDYKKTISILESDLKYYKNVLDKIKLVDNSKLANLADTSGCPTNKDMTGVDFIACALHSYQGHGGAITPSFLTMVYNELLHYQEFMFYYTNWLGNETSSEKTVDGKDRKLVYNAMMNDFRGYFKVQKEALQLAQQNLENFSMTYPLHIRILLYVEKVEKFRSKYSDVITLFYSLSEKLQNVQIQP